MRVPPGLRPMMKLDLLRRLFSRNEPSTDHRALETAVEQRNRSDEQNEQLQTTLHSIGDAVITTDAQGDVTFLNPIAEQLTGWSRAEAKGRPLAEIFRIINEDTRQTVENPVEKVFATGAIVGLANHTVLIARDGAERPIDDSAAPIRGGDGAVRGVVLVFRDISERKKAEAAQAILASIVENSDDVIVSKTLEGIVTSWNRAAERLFGYTADEMIGQSITRLLPPDRPDEENVILARLRRGEKIDHYESQRMTKDGRIIDVALTISPVRDSHGQIIGASKILRDITERKAAAEALRQSEQRYRSLFDNNLDPIFSLDEHGYFAAANPVAQRISGYTLEELKKTHFLELCPPELRDDAVQAFREALCKQCKDMETGMIRKGGERVDLFVTGAPVIVDDVVVGVSCIARDITERKRRENQVRDTEERLRSVLNHIVDGIITIDERGTIEGLNPAAEKLFQYSRAELIGKNVKELMPEPYHGQHDTYIDSYLQTGNAKVIGIGREVVGRRRDGSTFPMELGVSEFHLGSRRYFTGIVNDITERKRLEDELRATIGQLHDADRRKDEFLATLAHELRNPLAPLRSALEILAFAGDKPGTFAKMHNMMERQLAHLVRLVDDLLDVSRITRGKIELRNERLDVATILNAAVETSRPVLSESQHELSIVNPAEPLFVDGDLLRLSQVVSNLLNNSAKYTPEGGRIELTAEREGNEAVIRVRDNGIGIPAEMLPKVFEMFTQIDRTLNRSRGGLGIGLTLVKRLVEMHGGAVEAHSEGENEGSEFVVRLPLANPSISDQPASGPGVPVGTSAVEPKQRILVVDDNLDAARTLDTLLRMRGHEVRMAHTGQEALAVAAEFLPQVVLLDIGLPDMVGYEVARRLRRMPELGNVILIAQTGWGQDEDRRRSREAGFDAHLVKPVELGAIRQVLATLGQNQ
jgi:PAS domain S-box-containing protein